MDTEQAQTGADTEIESLLREKIRYIKERNLEAILARYTPDVITFDFKDPLQNTGTNAIKQRLLEWFAGYQGAINQEMSELKITTGGDVAVSYCLIRTYGTTINGEEQSMWYRSTNSFRKIDGKWFIAHEHVSDPVDMATGKAMFNLKP